MLKILFLSLILITAVSCDKQAADSAGQTDQVATKKKEDCKDDPVDKSKVPEFNEKEGKGSDGMSFGEDSGAGQKGCKVK